jgi:hypothetical protein
MPDAPARSTRFLLPDGAEVAVVCDAHRRGGRWTGTITLLDAARSLERGDVCRLILDEEPLRIVITEVFKQKRYSFVSLVKPDPAERL